MDSGGRRICRQQRRRRMSVVAEDVVLVVFHDFPLEELGVVFDQLPVGQLPVDGDLGEEVSFFIVAAVNDRLDADRKRNLKRFNGRGFQL